MVRIFMDERLIGKVDIKDCINALGFDDSCEVAINGITLNIWKTDYADEINIGIMGDDFLEMIEVCE